MFSSHNFSIHFHEYLNKSISRASSSAVHLIEGRRLSNVNTE